MGLFSWFGAPDKDVKGSHSDKATKSVVEYYEDDDIEDQVQNAYDRDDSVSYSDKDFHDSAIHQRYDEDGQQIVQGPQPKD